MAFFRKFKDTGEVEPVTGGRMTTILQEDEGVEKAFDLLLGMMNPPYETHETAFASYYWEEPEGF